MIGTKKAAVNLFESNNHSNYQNRSYPTNRNNKQKYSERNEYHNNKPIISKIIIFIIQMINKTKNNDNESYRQVCRRCGYDHFYNNNPCCARKHDCNKSKKKVHYEKYCMSRNVKEVAAEYADDDLIDEHERSPGIA